MDYVSLFVTKDDDSMNNNDRIQKIADEYKQEINSYDFRQFALQIITKCGAVAFRKVEETLSQDFSSSERLTIPFLPSQPLAVLDLRQ